ncbi:MAG: SBBP repeat-containing protein, partial [Terriglobales bacterium]
MRQSFLLILTVVNPELWMPMSRMPARKLPCPTATLPLTLILMAGLPLMATKPAATPRPVGRLQPVHLPLAFELNQGQTAAPVEYLARSQGSVVFLTGHGATVKTSRETAGFEFAGSRWVAAKGEARLATGVNYFVGGQPKNWRTAVPAFQRVEYRGIYPGVEVVYYGNAGRLEYDLRVAPGANVNVVRLAARGVRGHIGHDGALHLGAMALQRPLAYQEVNGRRVEVAAGYVPAANGEFKLALGRYDHSRTLVVDPVLVFSTLLGGTSFNQANAVAMDGSGDAYVAGYTLSTDFPVAGGLTPNAPNGDFAAYVAKVAPDGTSLVYSTYLGGALED